MSNKATNEAAGNLIGAMAAGILPHMRMDIGHNAITLQVPADWYGVTPAHVARDRKTMEKVRELFPGGREFAGHGRFRHFVGRIKGGAETAAYRHTTESGVLLEFTYITTHVCTSFKATAEVPEGMPAVVKWRCSQCGTVPTVTYQRAVGLLPPLPRKTGTPA